MGSKRLRYRTEGKRFKRSNLWERSKAASKVEMMDAMWWGRSGITLILKANPNRCKSFKTNDDDPFPRICDPNPKNPVNLFSFWSRLSSFEFCDCLETTRCNCDNREFNFSTNVTHGGSVKDDGSDMPFSNSSIDFSSKWGFNEWIQSGGLASTELHSTKKASKWRKYKETSFVSLWSPLPKRKNGGNAVSNWLK